MEDRIPIALAVLTALHHNDALATAIVTDTLDRTDLLALVVLLGEALLYEYERDEKATGRTVTAALQEMALLNEMGESHD